MADETTNNGQEVGIIQVNSPRLKNIDSFMSNNINLTEVNCSFPYVESAVEAFKGCSNLTTFKGDYPRLTNAKGMLYNTGLSEFITTYETMHGSNTTTMPKVTNASEMLWGCGSLQTVNINMPEVLNVDGILQDCNNLKTVTVNMPKLGTSEGKYLTLPASVTTLTANLPKVTTFVLPTNIQTVNSSDFSSITNGNTFFTGCSQLNSIAAKFGSITSFNNQSFSNTLTTAQLDFTSNGAGTLADGSNLFNGCSQLSTLSLNGLSNLKTGSNMFKGCSAITRWQIDMNNLVNAEGMFGGCTGLTYFSGYTGSLENGSGMFEGCSNLSEVHMRTSSLQNGSQMFINCSKLKEIKIVYESPDSTGYDYNLLKIADNMFDNTAIEKFGDSTNSVAMPSLISARGMFANTSKFSDSSSFNIHTGANCADASYMFAHSTISYNGQHATSGTNYFKITYSYQHTAAAAYASVHEGNVNTPTVGFLSNTTGMFKECKNITKFDGTACDTSNVVNGEGMFHNCTNLSGFTAPLNCLLSGYNMFCGCKLDQQSIDMISSGINNIRSLFDWTDPETPTVKNESDWTYYGIASTTGVATEGDKPVIQIAKDKIIDADKRGILHVDFDESVTPLAKSTFKQTLLEKGWRVVSCADIEDINFNISEDNKSASGTSYIDNVGLWKEEILNNTVYDLKVNRIISEERDGEIVGVMYGSSKFHTESTDSGTES